MDLQKQKFLLNSLILGSVLFTLILWFGQIWLYNGWYFVDNINRTAVTLKYFGKASALITTMLICWSFIINPSFEWCQKLFGQKELLLQKKIQLTKIAFVLMFVDPILLAFNRLPDIGLFLQFFGFRPITSLYGIGHNLGLILIILIVGCTLILKFSWINNLLRNFLRAVFGLIPFLIFAHVLLVKGDISKYFPLQIWIFGWILVSILAFVTATIIELKG